MGEEGGGLGGEFCGFGEEGGGEGGEDVAEGEAGGVAVYDDDFGGVLGLGVEVGCEVHDEVAFGAVAVEAEVEAFFQFEDPLIESSFV